MTHHIELDGIHLCQGAGEGDDLCLLQWTARFAGERVTDHPVCTSPVLAAFGIAWNDGLDDERRQKLIPFIPRLVGTSGDPAADEVRAWMATDWLVRTFTPTWLRKAGLASEADALVALPELTSGELAAAAHPVIEQARAKAAAAWDAARAAARAAAGDAAWDAAAAAAGDAAGDAAWDAARAAARAAAGDAARAAAAAAARAAARAAAWDAARAAAWDAAWDAARAAAWDAARAAARAAASKKKGYTAQYDAAYKASRSVLDEALADTTAELFESAYALFSRMIDAKAAA